MSGDNKKRLVGRHKRVAFMDVTVMERHTPE